MVLVAAYVSSHSGTVEPAARLQVSDVSQRGVHLLSIDVRIA
jgi:hypothetical protein